MERGAAAQSATPEAVASPGALPPITATPDDIAAILDDAMASYHLKAAIARVVIDDRELATVARGESMNGVPATPEMHFRNGAVAISYISTALLILVDRGVVTLEDKLSTWLPDLPESDKVTLKMLANLTAGYTDYVNTPGFVEMNYLNVFRTWTPEEIIEVSLKAGRAFSPGENWAYSHTDYVILGLALEKISGKPLAELLRELVLDPLGLVNTQSWDTPYIPSPVLHAYSSERKATLQIPDAVPFYEESTYWDPSWTIAHGAIQTTNIYDLTASAAGIGAGVLLSPASYAAQMSRELAGFGHAHELAIAQHHAAFALVDLEPRAERDEQDQQKDERGANGECQVARLDRTDRLYHLDICRLHLHFQSLSVLLRLRSESTAAMPRASR